MKVIKEFRGFSGSLVELVDLGQQLAVRKQGNVQRNWERMQALSQLGFDLPKILDFQDQTLIMEYVPGLDMRSYLENHHYLALEEFLVKSLEVLSKNSQPKDYTQAYVKKLGELDFGELPFTAQELLDRLPKILPQSNYHGDLTLENILYNKERGFVFIDPASLDFDSYVFDIAKLRQDLELGWFVRDHRVSSDLKLKLIQDRLLKQFPLADDCYLLILMLLRVYAHSKPQTKERTFILQGIEKLWK